MDRTLLNYSRAIKANRILKGKTLRVSDWESESGDKQGEREEGRGKGMYMYETERG